jgi:hypothetical protein
MNADPVLNDRSTVPIDNPQFYKDVKAVLAKKGIDLTIEDRAMMALPNTVNAVDCYCWFEIFAASCGCNVPDSEQIHIDKIEYKDIWLEYYDDVGEERALGFDEFMKLWLDCFPHVRVREHKQCCGKCMTCLRLTSARRETSDKDKRRYLTSLFAAHRRMFMGERKSYAERRFLATHTPERYLSTISDGMAQLHCLLPYFANKMSVNQHYKQHIQAVLSHGRNLVIYRSFNNISNGANLAIHCWLLSLERCYKANNNKLPDTIFCQVDGGPENSNWVMKGICELLVAKGLTKKVVMTRLPPGHTHEDIDAVFGKIWSYLEAKTVYTPQGYKRAIEACLQLRNIEIDVINIMCVPNYKLYMKGYVDPQLSRCDKGKWAELQWFFDKVPVSELYPCGVKVTYRKFASEVAWVIDELFPPKVRNNTGEGTTGEEEKESEADRLWKDAKQYERDYGFSVRAVKINTHPVIEKPGDVNGMYILKSLPDGTKSFVPMPFIANSKRDLDALVNGPSMRKHGNVPGVKREWEEWKVHPAPHSDDAVENCQRVPLVVPFLNVLFNGSIIDVDTEIIPTGFFDGNEAPPVYETTNSVIWGNRGHKSRSLLLVLFSFSYSFFF